jgi:Mrp family chromosome partitioning ATPase
LPPRPNDSTREEKAPTPKRDDEKIGPVLKSLDAVVNHVLAAGRGGAPRALLVACGSPKVDATREAIAISRALVDRREQIVLVDLARGPAAISGPLELPRAPGLTDVTAGRSGFEDVVKVDAATPLQVIPAGNPKLAAGGDENERFTPVFEALMQAYDCVVLHADLEAVRKLAPALKFELPVVVAVLPAGASAISGKTDLNDLASLGCPVVVYQQEGKQQRSGLFRRVAAG